MAALIRWLVVVLGWQHVRAARQRHQEAAKSARTGGHGRHLGYRLGRQSPRVCHPDRQHVVVLGRATGGQLGNGDLQKRLSPTQVAGSDWATVSGGDLHSGGTRTDGSLWCWGDNSHGELGNGTVDDSLRPTRVGMATNWWTITAGGGHSCGRQADGTASCWGANFKGQLGDNTLTQRNQPVHVRSFG